MSGRPSSHPWPLGQLAVWPAQQPACGAAQTGSPVHCQLEGNGPAYRRNDGAILVCQLWGLAEKPAGSKKQRASTPLQRKSRKFAGLCKFLPRAPKRHPGQTAAPPGTSARCPVIVASAAPRDRCARSTGTGRMQDMRSTPMGSAACSPFIVRRSPFASHCSVCRFPGKPVRPQPIGPSPSQKEP